MTAGPVKINQLFVVLVLVAAVILAVTAIWITLHPYGDNSADFPDGIFYVCQGQGCGEGFVLTVKEFERHHQKHLGNPVPCPKCGGTKTSRAERCGHCGRMFPMVKLKGKPLICPYPDCKKTVRQASGR